MPEPFDLCDSTLYPETWLVCEVGLSPNALMAARRSGSLRYKRVGMRIMILGSWLRRWLESDTTLDPQGQAVHA